MATSDPADDRADAMNQPAHPRPGRHFGPSGPITWAFLDADKDAEQLADLTQWVDWLRWRFTLDHRAVPECWAQHGPIVEELSALYTAWQSSFTYSNDGAAPLQWMAQFAFARQRLADWSGRTGCRPGEHRS